LLGVLALGSLAGATICHAEPGPIWRGPGAPPSGVEVTVVDEGGPWCELGGRWFWLRSPDEEKRVVASLYNRYCIRCHAVDGRGVWDIPDVPDFTSPKWQSSRSDAQLARIIIEGRGAIMPPFRGTLTLEEAWAVGRYLRTFVPGTEVSRPDLRNDKEAGKRAQSKQSATPKK
jgi:hypothetical protein